MKITHIVGLQGTGKSTLAMLMVSALEKRGARCAVEDSEAMSIYYKGSTALAVAANTGVDHLFLEWMPHSFANQSIPLRGARVIHIIDIPDLADPATTQEGQVA